MVQCSQRLERQSRDNQKLASAFRQLQASQAAMSAEVLQTGTVVRRLQQQDIQRAVVLTSAVYQGLGSGPLAMASAAAAAPAIPVRAAKSLAGRRRQHAEAVQQKQQQQRQQAGAHAGAIADANANEPKWQRWEGIHFSLDRTSPLMRMPLCLL